MIAIHVGSEPAQAFEHRLRLYGVDDIHSVKQDQFSGPFKLAKALPGDHVLLVYDSNKLSNNDLRRLTLNTVRLPRLLSVWDGHEGDNIVAARVPWQSVQAAFEGPGSEADTRRVLEKVCQDLACKRYSLSDLSSGDATRVGGSFAKSGVMRYFRKIASGRGAIKLAEEMAFYQNLPETLAPLYPELLFIKEKAGEVAFGIQYHDIPNLRDLILNCAIGGAESANIIRKVLQFEYGRAYANFLEPTPENYLHDYHFHRVWRRIQITSDLDHSFNALIRAKWLNVNGKRIPNIPAMLHHLESNQQAHTRLTPEGVSKYVHSDLHLENILVDRQNNSFMLVDPRGYPVCDIYYDLGKLAHSYNGKYDLLHEGRHKCAGFTTCTADDSATIDFSFTCPTLVETYNEINTSMTSIVHEVMGATTPQRKSDIDLRTRFNEAMHFCSDMPFHIHPDANPNISVPIYATGALLLAETLEMLGLDPVECASLQERGLARLAEMGNTKWIFEA